MQWLFNNRPALFCAAGLLLTVLSIAGPAAAQSSELFSQGQNFFKSAEYDQAFDKFQSYINANPNHFQVRTALFYMGESRRLSGKCSEAVAYYRKLTSRYKHSKHMPDAYFHTAGCYREMKDHARSKVAYRYYLRKFPYHKLALSAHYQLGDLYYSDRSFDQATELFLKVSGSLKKRAPKDHRARALKQDVDFKLGMIYARHKKSVPLAYRYLKPLSEDQNYAGRFKSRAVLRDITSFQLNSKNGLSGNSISAIRFDGSDIWVGTWLSGLIRYRRDKGKFHVLRKDGGLVSDAVRDVLVDFDNVWVSTYDGLTLLDKKTGKAATVGGEGLNKIQGSYKDGAYIYFATLGRGVFRYNRNNKEFGRLAPSDMGAKYIQRISGSENELYFCSLKSGLVIYNQSQNKSTVVGPAEGLSGPAVNDALRVDNEIWIAVHGQGIDVYDRSTGKITKKYAPGKDTVHPVVTTLRRRGNHVWAATLGGGVRVYDLKSGRWQKYTVIDGLGSDDVRRLEFEDDYVWIGTLDRGITIVYWPKGQTKP